MSQSSRCPTCRMPGYSTFLPACPFCGTPQRVCAFCGEATLEAAGACPTCGFGRQPADPVAISTLLVSSSESPQAALTRN